MDLARRRSPGYDGAAFCAKAAKNNADERTIHALAHYVAKDRARGANESSSNDQQVITEHETSCSGRPTGIAVEHRHHDRHIRSADGHDEVNAENAGDNR